MTKVELLTAAAEDLHVKADGQDLSAEVQSKLNKKYLALHAMLASDPGVTWALDESIPAKFESPVIAMLCALSCNTFGVGGDRKATFLLSGMLYQNPMSPAERHYRRVLAEPYVPTPQHALYY